MRIQKIGVFYILLQAPIYTTLSIAKGHGTTNHPLMINFNDLQSIPLNQGIHEHYSYQLFLCNIRIIWNKRRNPMQLTQRKRKDTTVMSEEKVESAFALTPGKPTRLFLLDKISFQNLKPSRL